VRELATKTELFPFDFSKNRTEASAQEHGIKNESTQIRVRNRGFATAEPKILTTANLRNFTRRDEPGQIPRTKKTPIFQPPITPARTSFDATLATRGTSSDVGGRRPFVKSTVIQQTEGLGCGEMISCVERDRGRERWGRERAQSSLLSGSARS
jgi:hypothetical protein